MTTDRRIESSPTTFPSFCDSSAQFRDCTELAGHLSTRHPQNAAAQSTSLATTYNDLQDVSGFESINFTSAQPPNEPTPAIVP